MEIRQGTGSGDREPIRRQRPRHWNGGRRPRPVSRREIEKDRAAFVRLLAEGAGR